MTRVLLTGAGGFVGSHVLEVLLTDTDWEVVAVDSFRHNGAFDRASHAIHLGAGPEYARGERTTAMAHDLTVPFSPRQLGTIGKLDYIIHVASRCSVDESIADPADFVRNNVDSTLTVLELARTQWCHGGRDVKLFDHRLLHLSTDEVYGPGRVEAHTDHRPSSPYAASKAAQEDLVHAWCHTFGIPATVVTSANMFGQRQSQLAYIPRVVGAALSGRQLPIHAWHGQPGLRRYTYAPNTARAVVDLLTAPERAIQPIGRVGRLPLPGQHEIDNLQLALRVASLVGRPLRYELVDGPTTRPGYDPGYRSLSGDGGWAPIPFDDGLERTVKWYVEHPEWLQ